MRPSAHQCMSEPQRPTARNRTRTSPARGPSGIFVSMSSSRFGSTSGALRIIAEASTLSIHGAGGDDEDQGLVGGVDLVLANDYFLAFADVEIGIEADLRELE